MQLFDTTQLVLERALYGASMRNAAIGSNIANANTPGYAPKDVDFHGALAAALQEGREAVEQVSFSIEADADAPMRADGSGFDMESQASNLASNGLEYEALISVTRARSDILRAALGTR
jgi:flagellar basal-body rod protein FlgB